MTGRRPRPHRAPALGAAVCAVAALVGCSADPPSAPVPPASASPAPSYPAVPGSTVSTSAFRDLEWYRVVRVGDSEAAYREARRLLVAGGYTLTKDRKSTGGGDGEACTADLCVGFTATDGTDAGPIVSYDVFRPTGVGG